jgi:hypothetical protein
MFGHKITEYIPYFSSPTGSFDLCKNLILPGSYKATSKTWFSNKNHFEQRDHSNYLRVRRLQRDGDRHQQRFRDLCCILFNPYIESRLYYFIPLDLPQPALLIHMGSRILRLTFFFGHYVTVNGLRHITVNHPGSDQRQHSSNDEGQLEGAYRQNAGDQRPQRNPEAETHRNDAHLASFATSYSEITSYSEGRRGNSCGSKSLDQAKDDKLGN